MLCKILLLRQISELVLKFNKPGEMNKSMGKVCDVNQS